MSLKVNKILSVAFAGVLSCTVLGVAGCAGTTQVASSASASSESSESSSSAVTSKQYMSDMNQKAADLNTRLASFVDAVSREDTVAMRIQADSAQEVIDQILALQAPDELVQIKADYDGGAAKLKAALDEYIELYTQIAQAKQSGSYDASGYTQKIADVQAFYDQGIELIKKADQAAAELN